MNKLLNLQINFKKAVALAMVLFVVISGFVYSYKSTNAAATPPRMITYQGRILNANGVPVSDASVNMIFEFYDSLAGGICIWSNSASDCSTATARSVTLTDGLFTQNLGDTGDSYVAIPTTVFDDASVYLQVTVGGETLSPRKRLVATPYAMNSDMLDGNDSSSFFSLAGNNTITGANTFSGSTFLGTIPFVFEGTTSDDFETQFAIIDPALSDKTITFQNASGTVAYLNDIGWTDSGTTVYATTATDSVVIGGTVATASTFGVVPSTGYIYFGDGAVNPVLNFKDATAGTGNLTYNNDNWEFDGGEIIHSSMLAYASAPGDAYGFKTTSNLFGAAGGGAGTYDAYQLFAQINNQSAELALYDQMVSAIDATAINSGTGAINSLVGVEALVVNSSTAASSIEQAMYGVSAEVYNGGAGVTIPTAVGLYGRVYATAGTITDAIGVYGEILAGPGTLTRAYGGYFTNTTDGTSRYGVYGTASGGTNNYAGYFHGSAVHIDNTAVPSTALYSTGTGDLYVYDQLEVDGTGETGGTIMAIENSTLTSGIALKVTRSDSISDYTGSSTGLVSFSMEDVASDGGTLYLLNGGTGSSLSINQLGDQTALFVSAFGTTDYIGTFFNDGNLDTNMGLDIQACLYTNPTAACNFLALKDGNGTVLGAIEGNGAGGVTNASAGSDYAELFSGQLSDFAQGDIVGIDTAGGAILASDATRIIGAYSVAPNTLGNWFEGWRETGAYVPVALLGQVPVSVNDEGGAITAGDYLTLSSTPGVAMKATGVGYVIGRALESHESGAGTVNVYVQPKWQAINVLAQDGSITTVNTDLALSSKGTADGVNTGIDSYGLMLRGSGWDGASAQDVSMSILNDVSNSAEYRLSFKDSSDSEVGFINQDGDLAISGKLYPSDRGVLQTDKYIYYDGSSGLGGDFIRTNASGWGSGSYDFAEMFPTVGEVAPGEVVIFADSKDSVSRSDGKIYDEKIAGIVSTQPGFLAGNNIDGHVPIALAGRVPTFVSAENGAISIGDPLTSSSIPGVAMKATENGQIVGFAMEAFSQGTGSISVFVRPSYFDGQTPDLSDNIATEVQSPTALDLGGVVNVNGGSLLSVGSIAGIGNNWSISEDGTITTNSRFVQNIKSYSGDDISAYAIVSTQTTVELSGTIELENGRAHIIFEEIDPSFNDVIDNMSSYRVFVTAHGETGSLYATDRDIEGFIIRDTENTSNVEVDWLVIAYHKDYAPEPDVVEDNIAPESEIDQDPSSIPTTGGIPSDIVSDQSDGETGLDVVEDDSDGDDTSGDEDLSDQSDGEIVEEAIDDISQDQDSSVEEVLGDVSQEQDSSHIPTTEDHVELGLTMEEIPSDTASDQADAEIVDSAPEPIE